MSLSVFIIPIPGVTVALECERIHPGPTTAPMFTPLVSKDYLGRMNTTVDYRARKIRHRRVFILSLVVLGTLVMV